MSHVGITSGQVRGTNLFLKDGPTKHLSRKLESNVSEWSRLNDQIHTSPNESRAQVSRAEKMMEPRVKAPAASSCKLRNAAPITTARICSLR